MLTQDFLDIPRESCVVGEKQGMFFAQLEEAMNLITKPAMALM